MSSSLQFSEFTPYAPFRLILASDASEDMLRVYVLENGLYRVDYHADLKERANVGNGPHTPPIGRCRYFSEFDPARVDVKQYLSDILELTLVDDKPPKFIHLLAPGYPVTVFNMDSFTTSDKALILRIFANYMKA